MSALVTVEARANIFDMRYGERAQLPEDHPEVLELLARGLLIRVEGGELVESAAWPAPTPRRPCGCH